MTSVARSGPATKAPIAHRVKRSVAEAMNRPARPASTPGTRRGRQGHPATYFRQSCSSRNPSTSRIFRFENSASFSPISRVTGTPGK